jgi:hypothetical protein
VELRLRDREPSFVVTAPLADRWADETAPTGSPPGEIPSATAVPPSAAGEDEATVRISLRLPEHLKGRVEQSAARAGVSINTWLIRAATATVAAEAQPQTAEYTRTSGTPSGGQRFNGWVR